MHRLVNIDHKPGPCIRYVTINHLIDNDNFVENYFNTAIVERENNINPGLGVNLRRSTRDLNDLWEPHNTTYTDSINARLWRFKVYNGVNNSIDVVECWKTIELCKHYFQSEYINSNGQLWGNVQRLQLYSSLLNHHFNITELIATTSNINCDVGFQYFNARQYKTQRCVAD